MDYTFMGWGEGYYAYSLKVRGILYLHVYVGARGVHVRMNTLSFLHQVIEEKRNTKGFQKLAYCKVDCSHQRMNNQDKLDKIKSLEKLGIY
jgi:hypothetical protein